MQQHNRRQNTLHLGITNSALTTDRSATQFSTTNLEFLWASSSVRVLLLLGFAGLLEGVA